MIRFECDYTEGAHPRILQRLIDTNFEQTSGYGCDEHCENARNYIRRVCDAPDADVHFLVGGTQTNLTVIASTLRPYQGVIAAESGHINVHETGAIEASGHKVLSLPSNDGTITAAQIENTVEEHYADVNHEHVVQPGMVYLSFPTENGTLYTKTQLEEISRVCRKYKLPLFIDGARMGYGLTSPANDLTLADFSRLADVFYIGGTKVGALFGEALVITSDALKKDFRYSIKQRGGMLAKGRLLGIQFEALFEDNLYMEISRHAVEMALRIKHAFAEKGIGFLYDSYTNQQFPILTNRQLQALEDKYAFTLWCNTDDSHSAVRFCTSWAVREEDVEKLISDIQKL